MMQNKINLELISKKHLNVNDVDEVITIIKDHAEIRKEINVDRNVYRFRGINFGIELCLMMINCEIVPQLFAGHRR